MLILGATIVTNARRIAADDFFAGLPVTALEDNEIITAIEFPVVEKFNYQFPGIPPRAMPWLALASPNPVGL